MTARQYVYLFCCLFIAPVTARLQAQVLYGSIVGTVTDPSAAVIAKAQIKAVNPATGETREATTDDAGHFTLSNLIPGSYDIRISAPEFPRRIRGRAWWPPSTPFRVWMCNSKSAGRIRR